MAALNCVSCCCRSSRVGLNSLMISAWSLSIMARATALAKVAASFGSAAFAVTSSRLVPRKTLMSSRLASVVVGEARSAAVQLTPGDAHACNNT